MDSIAQMKPSPLAAGFYSVPEAARLIEVGDVRRIYGWLRASPKAANEPLIHRDFQPMSRGAQELSFLDLMELRAIEFFRDLGVKTKTIRAGMAEARRALNTEHPFASRHIAFRADEKDVYLDDRLRKVGEDEGDSLFHALFSQHLESYALLRETIGKGVEYDPASGLAIQWTPRAAYPDVTLNPRKAFGRPALPGGIGTATLFNAWTAEGESYDEVAYWFRVPANDVRQAVDFERKLSKAA